MDAFLLPGFVVFYVFDGKKEVKREEKRKRKVEKKIKIKQKNPSLLCKGL